MLLFFCSFTGVRVANDVGRRDACDVLDVGPHLARSQRAVQAQTADCFVKEQPIDPIQYFLVSQKENFQGEQLPERIRVRDAGDEGLARLARQSAAAAVHDGPRNLSTMRDVSLIFYFFYLKKNGWEVLWTHQNGHRVVLVVEEVLDGEQGRLGVGRVEDGLHQQHVDAAVQQGARLLRVRRHQLVEGCFRDNILFYFLN